MKLPLREAVDLIGYAITEEQKEKIYQIWLVRYPNYDKSNFETFEQFYEKCRPQKVSYDMRSKDEIMNEILNRKEG